MGETYKLMEGANFASLDFDSTFSIMLANKDIFVASKDEKKDEVHEKYSGKEQCKVLICTSQANKVTQMFPLLKDKDDQKVIQRMRLAIEDLNMKTINLTPMDMDSSQLLETFYITKESFGKYKDNYVMVTEKCIRIYNRNMKLRLIFEGLNIRGCR